MDLINYTKEFGFKSKALGVLSPGAWMNKEAEKYLHDDEASYKKARGKAALKGALSPITSTIKFVNARKLHEQGLTSSQIREELESSKRKRGRVASRITEALTLTPSYTNAAAVGIAGAAIATGDRKKFK